MKKNDEVLAEPFRPQLYTMTKTNAFDDCFAVLVEDWKGRDNWHWIQVFDKCVRLFRSKRQTRFLTSRLRTRGKLGAAVKVIPKRRAKKEETKNRVKCNVRERIFISFVEPVDIFSFCTRGKMEGKEEETPPLRHAL